MKIRFNRLSLLGFKSYLKETIIEFGENATIIEGRNGSGKSTIGEAITWILFGSDLMGSTMDPTNIFTKRDIEAKLLVVNGEGKQLEFVRSVKNGKNTFYLNDVPTKATEYKQTVEKLFTKEEFLTLFNPLYFFTQHWTQQRAQILEYIKQPLNEVVLKRLPTRKAEALGNELKQLPLEKIEAKHKDLKKHTDVEMVQLRERVSTLESMTNKDPHKDLKALKAEWTAINKELTEHQQMLNEYNNAHTQHEKLIQKANDLYEAIQKQVKVVEGLQGEAFETHCSQCGQELNEEAKAKAEQVKLDQLAKAKARGKEILQERKAVMELIKLNPLPAAPRNVKRLQERAMQLQEELTKSAAPDYTNEIEAAKDKLLKVKMAHIDSVEMLDAITQFKQEKAHIMVHEVNNLFENIGVKLFETMKNGENKATFEIEYMQKPFSKLSNAEKIKCGLELREVYIKICEKDLPVLIDNFESISGKIAAGGQVVTMAVKDKDLNIKQA